ncbi:MAG TPA: methyltransferase domain-containing protein [Roseiflexaceae bacterium]|nr:methyltransferase domain-containing protein [Roseiflexaceae bacterium]
MDHHEMVALIQAGVHAPGGVWADLGAGTGNFSWALAEHLGPHAMIHTLDRDARAVAAQQARIQRDPPAATIIAHQGDVQRRLDLPPLDGILCANLLHFINDQAELLGRLAAQLRPGGRLLVVEYEQQLPLPWVPHPLPFARFVSLATTTGFAFPTRVGMRRSPSSGQVMYAAVGMRPRTELDNLA